MSTKFLFFLIVTAIWLVLFIYVLINVWKLKCARFLKFIIAAVAMLLPPAGFIWYIILRRKDKKRKKRDKDKDKDKK